MLVILMLFALAQAQTPAFFTSTLPAAEMQNKQAVLETSAGTIVLDLLPEAAPTHVSHFITKVREGAYDGTTFHRVIAMGIIQGGDPISKDPAQKEKYGTGGLGVLKFEPNDQKMTRGAVAAVLVPGQRDSAGNQFFIVITDQNALTGQYTVFARVVEGINNAQKISLTPADNMVPSDRIEIRKATIRDKPAPEPDPFSTETVDQLSKVRAVIETSIGNMTVQFYPDKAPMTVRNFLRLAQSGVFDGTAIHRVVKGFVAQGGYMPMRKELLDDRQQSYVRRLPLEVNSTPHEKGTLSMARGDDPDSATTSFFIVLARTPALDKTYAAFGKVVEGLDVLEKIEQSPVNGEAPVTRIDVNRVRVIRP
jgi:peptidyl-prolyl cis-trans isomerase B (cyclophilin B)